jgi:hypothetical protein
MYFLQTVLPVLAVVQAVWLVLKIPVAQVVAVLLLFDTLFPKFNI